MARIKHFLKTTGDLMKTVLIGLLALSSFVGVAFGEDCRKVTTLNNYTACAESIENTVGGFTLIRPTLAGLDIKPSSHVAKQICMAFEGDYKSSKIKILGKSEGVGKWIKKANDIEVSGPLGADTFPANTISKIMCANL